MHWPPAAPGPSVHSRAPGCPVWTPGRRMAMNKRGLGPLADPGPQVNGTLGHLPLAESPGRRRPGSKSDRRGGHCPGIMISLLPTCTSSTPVHRVRVTMTVAQKPRDPWLPSPTESGSVGLALRRPGRRGRGPVAPGPTAALDCHAIRTLSPAPPLGRTGRVAGGNLLLSFQVRGHRT